jgi:hypothetical protein
MASPDSTTRAGRRATKFAPANIQKIKDFVAQGISREEIAKLLDVTVGSLQVTCSRLGIGLRKHNNAARIRVESRAFVSNGPVYAGHFQREPDSRVKFQLVLKSQGKKVTTELAIAASDVGRLGLDASAQGLGMTDLMSQVLARALKRGLIQENIGIRVVRPVLIDPGAQAGRGA